MKIKIIMLFVLILSMALISFCIVNDDIRYKFFPDSRNYYEIYEKNGQHYLVSCERSWPPGQDIEIEFEDDLALVYHYHVRWGRRGLIGTWNYVNREGNVVLRPRVYATHSFSEGLAAVMPAEGVGWGYMNKKGKMVIEPRYCIASMFKNGFASVLIIDIGGESWRWYLINKSGEHVQDLDEPLNWEEGDLGEYQKTRIIDNRDKD